MLRAVLHDVDDLLRAEAIAYVNATAESEGGVVRRDQEDDAHHAEMAQLVAAADLPRMREVMPYLIDCDLDAQFDFGLDLMLEGIRARIAETA